MRRQVLTEITELNFGHLDLLAFVELQEPGAVGVGRVEARVLGTRDDGERTPNCPSAVASFVGQVEALKHRTNYKSLSPGIGAVASV